MESVWSKRARCAASAALLLLMTMAGAALLTACSGGSQHDQQHDDASGPQDWSAGDYPAGVAQQTYLSIAGVDGQQGNAREYKVHVPPGYDPKVPTPAVFCLHGLQQNAVMFCVNGAGWVDKSDAEGFILIMPNGYHNSWNAGTCCGDAATAGLDDVALMRAIYAEVGQHLNIDRRRVYASGLSNGGFMSYRLACEAADLFVAIAPGSGAIGTEAISGSTNGDGDSSDLLACNPGQPVSVLDLHGTADTYVPFADQQPSTDRIATSNRCTLDTAAATQPASGGDTQCLSYDGCPAGIAVTRCSVDGGGHCWFGSPSCGTGAGAIGALFVGRNSDTLVNTDAAWSFFERVSR